MNKYYGDLNILGVGSQGGGRFGKVVIAGSGKITGDLECDSLTLPGAGKIEEGALNVHGPIEIDGAGKVEGAVNGESLAVNGSFKVEQFCEIRNDAVINGILKVESGPCVIGGRADVNGSAKIEGDFRVGNLDVDGVVKVEGNLHAAAIDVDGVLKVEGEVQAETFAADGIVAIDGLLNAETVELSVSGEDRIESIGGGRVTVRRGHRAFSLFSRKRQHLDSTLIEADEIDLEYTDAQIVRGVNVRIGPECVIDRVEFSGSLTTAPDASVREKVKV